MKNLIYYVLHNRITPEIQQRAIAYYREAIMHNSSKGYSDYLKSKGREPAKDLITAWQKIALENKDELQLENRDKFAKLKTDINKIKKR